MPNDVRRSSADVAGGESKKTAGCAPHVLREPLVVVVPVNRSSPPKPGRIDRLAESVRFLRRSELERRVIGRSISACPAQGKYSAAYYIHLERGLSGS